MRRVAGDWQVGSGLRYDHPRTLWFVYVTNQVLPPTATIAMGAIVNALGSLFAKLSDENYAQSLTFYRLWFDIGQTYLQTPSDQIFDEAFWSKRVISSMPGGGKLVFPTAHLIARFAGDTRSDCVLAPRSPEPQNLLYTGPLREFFDKNMLAAWYNEKGWSSFDMTGFYEDVNLIAHWANLGYAEEVTIRRHILQSLISHQKLHDHQADALIILFKLAGATFETYVDPSVVDRCFELLKGQYSNPKVRGKLVQVRVPRAVKGCHRSKTNFRR